jgi:cell division protein FtsQ
MNVKKNIRKIVYTICWSIIGAGVVVLFVAAMDAKNHKECKGYKINISGGGYDQWFVDKNDILKLITKNGAQKIKGRLIRSFQLQNMEEVLEKSQWIKDAELFFDNNQVLRVNIEERIPVARIFTSTGNSFYIDSSCRRLPISEKFSANVTVFTGFPSDKRRLSVADSQLLRQIQNIGSFILKDSIWMAQVAQINIGHTRTFELIPIIGNHTILFGDGIDYAKKFRRLKIFYQQVVSRVGDKYSTINVQYDRQVVAVRREAAGSLDGKKGERVIINK